MNESARYQFADGVAVASKEITLLNKYLDEATDQETKTTLFNIYNLFKKYEKNEAVVQDSLLTVEKARLELVQTKKDLKFYKLIANLADKLVESYDSF